MPPRGWALVATGQGVGPREEGGPADLVEEYSYIDLKINVGLGDIDFDIANRQYSFGRF